MEKPTASDRVNYIFGCPETLVQFFEFSDPFSRSSLQGQVCRQEGPNFGALSITAIGDCGCDPQFIYGIPQSTLPYNSRQLELSLVPLDDAHSFALLTRWAGLELQVYRFVDGSGQQVCSVKLRPHPQVLDCMLGPFRTWLLAALKWDEKEDFTTFAMQLFPPLQDPVIQSVTVVLSGAPVTKALSLCEGKADNGPLSLKPIWCTKCDGPIVPYPSAALTPVSSAALLAATSTVASDGGGHLLVVDKDGTAVPYRTLYRIVPNGWCGALDLDAVAKRTAFFVRLNHKKWNSHAIREESFLSSEEWTKCSKHYLALLKDHISKAERGPQALILIGVPGSGKSTFASALCAADNTWRHVSQDLLGTRKACKAAIEAALDQSLNVVIDRCNVEPLQRVSWIEHLRKCGVSAIFALFFDTDLRTCKTRIMTRENHPTLPAVEKSKAVVDEFANSMTKPAAKEGFAEVLVVRTEKEVKAALARFSSRPLP